MGDKQFRIYADNAGPILVENETITPPDDSYTDSLKFSNVQNAIVMGCGIGGGSEDCIDMNRGCRSISIMHCALQSRGSYVMTIKDAEDILIADTTIVRHGSETDIDLGNWTDSSLRRTRRVTIRNVDSKDGKPVRVRVGNADWPKIIGGNCKIDYLGSLALKAYWWLKRFHLVK